jgi:hypothetical protein
MIMHARPTIISKQKQAGKEDTAKEAPIDGGYRN